MTFPLLYRVTAPDGGRLLLESVWGPHVEAFLACRRGQGLNVTASVVARRGAR